MDKSAREFVIFYAWQSDTPKSHNRYLIEMALNEACERLGADETIPYRMTVTADTAGVPGLCDIPAAILAKIEKADAVVLDLTYIAKSAGTRPKHCPNPNVLFELGYAFHAVGSDRLICVMNERHGPATEILFDIGHRRHPVSYRSPSEGETRKQILSGLVDGLTAALTPTVRLGPRSIGIDSDKAFELETNQIRSHWEANTATSPGPTVFFLIRPTRFEERRWPGANSLQVLLQQRQTVEFQGRHYYPPSTVETDVMPWGLYNQAYGSPAWALTYSGQFWAAIRIGSGVDYTRSAADHSLMQRSYEQEPVVPAGKWINFPHARIDIANPFRFAGSFAGAFHPQEQLYWSASAEWLGGTIVAATSPSFWIEGCRRCASPGAISKGLATADEFSSGWNSACLDFLEELFGMYDIRGERIKRDSFQKWLDPLVAEH